MKILWHSNAPWVGSGYGQQSALWVPLLAGLGHEVAISAFYGASGAPLNWGEHTVYPAGQAPYGWDVITGHAAHFGADLVITCMDTYCMEPEIAREMRRAGIKVAQWTPVDCEPLGVVDRTCLQVSGATPIAMSRFGERQLAAAILEPLYVPHGIDARTFHPVADRAGLRARMGLSDDTFIIGICSANKDQIRKAYPEQFWAFAQFHSKHPDSLLLVHAVAEGKSGIDLQALAVEAGIDDAVIFSDQYAQIAGMISPQQLAGWYAALDLLSCCSYGEGFGIPIIEAQACGVPVAVTDASSMTELAGAGWKVKGEPVRNPVHRARWTKPSVRGIERAYENAYAARGNRAALAGKAREFALAYDAAAVLTQYWKPALEAIERTDIISDYDGLKWRISNRKANGDTLALAHESLIHPHVLGLLPEGGVFLDIGAHVGNYTLRAARKASRVIAIEANPDTATRLLDNIELNELGNVQIYIVAAWDEATELHLSSPTGHGRDGSTQVRPGPGGDTGPARRTSAVRLDELLIDEPRIDVVKIDVEGADLHVLRGMAALLAEHRPVLFIEDHSVYGMYERADLNALLEELGYGWEDLPAYRGYVIARPS